MNIKPFIDFNSHCPICGNKLSLYLDFVDSKERFKAFQRRGRICFNTFKGYKQYYFNISPDGNIISNFKPNNRFCLFYLCNPEAIINNDVNPNVSCYYRSSYLMKIENSKIISLNDSIINGSEHFIFNKTEDNKEKYYILSFDYEEDETSLYHYTENDNNVLFNRTFNFIMDRLEFSNQKSVFDKFETWMMFY